jgi:LysR family hydrogen peroxide-inducible transcriptional activator
MPFSPHPFSLRQLQYVVAVADALSFRRAAESCHVSQPSLSSQIAELEAQLGVRIFERNKRRVLVTQAGRTIVERARRLLLDADDLVIAAKREGDPLRGSIKLGVIPTISPYLLPTVTPRLRALFPELTVHWVEDKTPALERALREGEIEAALVALEADLGDVESAVVGSDPFVLVGRADHPLLRHDAALPASELHEADVLLLDDGHCLRQQALALCRTARAHELALRATSLTTLVQMVAQGTGVTLLPELALAAETARTQLAVRRFEPPVPHRTIALVWRKGSPLAGALGELAGGVREAYRALAEPIAPANAQGRGRAPSKYSRGVTPTKRRNTR